MPEYCKRLARHNYTNIKDLKYTCDTKFYDEIVWKRGYELQTISQAQYNALNSDKKEIQPNPEFSKCDDINKSYHWRQSCRQHISQYLFFEKKYFSKTCWVD